MIAAAIVLAVPVTIIGFGILMFGPGRTRYRSPSFVDIAPDPDISQENVLRRMKRIIGAD